MPARARRVNWLHRTAPRKPVGWAKARLRRAQHDTRVRLQWRDSEAMWSPRASSHTISSRYKPRRRTAVVGAVACLSDRRRRL